jgi:Cellulase (glycosyl hydrolase family 5)
MKTMRFGAAVTVAASSMLTLPVLGCDSGTDDVVPTESEAGLDASPPPTGDDGGASVDDDSGFTGLSGDGGPCHPSFASGVNVAWIRFAGDVPNPNLAAFQTLFTNTYRAGGRVARWWFHTNGTKTPGYDANGMALPISPSNIADVKSILDTARNSGMMVTISLWSFDMLKGNIPAATLANNVSLLTVDANRQAYIDNVLTPLVTALRAYPGLYAWETFNEPEGMASGGQGWRPFSLAHGADGGTTGQSVDESYIQKTVNWFAAAIHGADPGALVTNGTWEFQAVANVTGMQNYYSDSALVGAGGLAGGTLDYYEVHYYSADGSKYSPFVNPASYWGLDKPIVVGEFYALAQDGVAAADTYTSLHGSGYSGAWAWQYENADGTNTSNGGQMTTWPSMQVPIQNLYELAPNDVDCP